MFSLIYPLEEVMFSILYYTYPEWTGLWISLIIIAICSTAVIDKWLLKKQNDTVISKNTSFNKKLMNEQKEIIGKLMIQIKELEDENRDLLDYIDNKLEKHGS